MISSAANAGSGPVTATPVTADPFAGDPSSVSPSPASSITSSQTGAPNYPATITVDLDGLAHNYRTMCRRAGRAQVMCVVKANAYGAGLSPVALRLWDEGARWFGVARVPEALALREHLAAAGRDLTGTRIFTWLADPQGGYQQAVKAGLDVSASSVRELEQIAAVASGAAPEAGASEPTTSASEATPDAIVNVPSVAAAKVHLKVDVGMGRGGARPEDWDALAAKARSLETEGLLEVVGIWAHLSQADDPQGAGRAVTQHQIASFAAACDHFESSGLNPVLRHLEATAGTLWFPDGHFDMVRIGLGLYGLSPAPEVSSSADLDLVPVIRYTTKLQGVKKVQPGDSVSYGGIWTADEPHWIGLLPVGYADGISRGLSNGAPVTVQTQTGPVHTETVGRICMDQTMISLGSADKPAAEVGDTVVLFGDPLAGEPSADQWANADQTVNYEVIASLPSTLPRQYLPKPPGGTS